MEKLFVTCEERISTVWKFKNRFKITGRVYIATVENGAKPIKSKTKIT